MCVLENYFIVAQESVFGLMLISIIVTHPKATDLM